MRGVRHDERVAPPGERADSRDERVRFAAILDCLPAVTTEYVVAGTPKGDGRTVHASRHVSYRSLHCHPTSAFPNLGRYSEIRLRYRIGADHEAATVVLSLVLRPASMTGSTPLPTRPPEVATSYQRGEATTAENGLDRLSGGLPRVFEDMPPIDRDPQLEPNSPPLPSRHGFLPFSRVRVDDCGARWE